MTRVLVHEDDEVRIFDVFDGDGQLVGQDVESKLVESACGACGRPY